MYRISYIVDMHSDIVHKILVCVTVIHKSTLQVTLIAVCCVMNAFLCLSVYLLLPGIKAVIKLMALPLGPAYTA